MRRRRARGFTLLEVAIAMAILVVALAALMGHEGIAVQMSDYSNRLSQATMLAQGKLLDVEYKLIKDGMDQFDGCEDGDFRAEGFRQFRWAACGYKLEMPEGAAEDMTQRFMGLLAGTGFGLAEGGEMDEKAALIAGQIQMAIGSIPTFLQQLEDKIRKVRVEVTWKDSIYERSLVIERFVTTLGQDRVGAVSLDTGNAEPPPGRVPPPDDEK